MSKERLEEIEAIEQEVANGFEIEDLNLNTMTVVNREHFEWLKEQAERVQELEKKNKVLERLRLMQVQQKELAHDRAEEYEEQNKHYREITDNLLRASKDYREGRLLAFQYASFVNEVIKALEGDPHES